MGDVLMPVVTGKHLRNSSALQQIAGSFPRGEVGGCLGVEGDGVGRVSGWLVSVVFGCLVSVGAGALGCLCSVGAGVFGCLVSVGAGVFGCLCSVGASVFGCLCSAGAGVC